MKKKSFFMFLLIFCSPLFFVSASAATVNCTFMSETTISKSGVWIKSEADFMKLLEMFGDGLTLPLENSLLGNLDSGQPFFAGSVARGKVFLMGGDMGIEGKLIGTGRKYYNYDGMCNVGFGKGRLSAAFNIFITSISTYVLGKIER